MASSKPKPGKRGANPDRLTTQQQIFIEAYFASKKMSATEAAEKAGYSNPGVAGCKLLSNPVVKAIVSKRLQEIIWEHKAERERVVRELTSIAFMNVQDLLKPGGGVYALKDLPPQVARSISHMKISYTEEETEAGNTVLVKHLDIKFWDKLSALSMLMNHLGMNAAQKHDVKVTVDWDTMTERLAEAPEEDPVERRILALNPPGSSVEVLPPSSP